MEYLSTSALANEHDTQSTELFEKFKNFGWIIKKNDKWVLTELGKQKGGQMKSTAKYGDYVVWPENISFNDQQQTKVKPKLLNTTALGQCFNISSKRLNLLLNELGWIEKTIAGWGLTKLGTSIGGKQFEHETSGNSYVLWPNSVMDNKDLLEMFQESPQAKSVYKENGTDFRKQQSGKQLIILSDIFAEIKHE